MAVGGGPAVAGAAKAAVVVIVVLEIGIFAYSAADTHDVKKRVGRLIPKDVRDEVLKRIDAGACCEKSE